MRILLRTYGGEEYVWKEATYKKENFFIVNNDGEDSAIEECNIAATDGHNMAGYVVCAYCGEMVLNTEEEIEKHYAAIESKRDCTTCDKLYVDGDHNTLRRTITPNEDGTYSVSDIITARLFCRNYYNKYEISTNQAKKVCKFLQCRRNGMREASDFFSKYPDAFDSIITVDAVVAQKYKYDKRNYISYGYTRRNLHMYDMKSRGTIKACVNENGIVECFQASSSGEVYRFFYSAKYDKMFYAKYGNYREGRPDYFSQKKYDELLTKVRALYAAAKEEKK